MNIGFYFIIFIVLFVLVIAGVSLYRTRNQAIIEIKIKSEIEQNIGGRFKKRFKSKNGKLKSSVKYFDPNVKGDEETVDGEIRLKT